MATPTTELLGDLRERMVRIETKLDAHAENRVSDREQIDDHEARLTKLESSYRFMAGIGAILLGLVTFFQPAISKLLGV